MPNAHLTINSMPEKFQGDTILKKFRKDHDYLNYVSYDKKYENKLHKGNN